MVKGEYFLNGSLMNYLLFLGMINKSLKVIIIKGLSIPAELVLSPWNNLGWSPPDTWCLVLYKSAL